MAAHNDERKRHFIITFIYLILILAIAYLVVKYLVGWVMPFIVAFLVAALVRPAVRFCHKKTGINLRVCGVLMVLLLVVLILLVCILGASRIAMALSDASQLVPQLTSQFSLALMALSERLSAMFKNIPQGTGLTIDTSLDNISKQILKLTSLAEGTGRMVTGVITSMPSMLLNIVVTVVAACFISADYPTVTGFLIRQLPQRHRETALELKSFFLTTIAKLVRAYLTLMLITFCELSVGLLLLRVHHTVAIAAVIALVDVMPVLGTGTVMIPWVAIELIMGKVYLAVGLALVYGIITVVRNILEPKIVGHHIGLHPLVTLAAIVVGLKALGFAGMIFFPLGIIILKHLRESGILRLWKD